MSSTVLPALGRSNLQLNLPDLLDFNLQHNPDFPVFVYAEPGSTGRTTEIKMLEYVRAAHRLGEAIRGDSQPGEVVAIVANIDAILYSSLIVGIMKVGLVVSHAFNAIRSIIHVYLAVPYLSPELANSPSPSPAQIVGASAPHNTYDSSKRHQQSQSRSRNYRPDICA